MPDCCDFCKLYLPFRGQRASDGEEGVEPSLRAALSALQDLLAAVTNPVLAAQKPR